jgi:hypothetical protein
MLEGLPCLASQIPLLGILETVLLLYSQRIVILVPLFDFLKKKSKVKIDIPTYGTEVKDHKTDDWTTGDEHNSSPHTLQANAKENSRAISIPAAALLLHSQEEIKVKELVEGLLPIKSSVEKLLRSTEKIADDLEKENIKVEDPRFESIVENSRRTIISSLRKESSSEINSLSTLEDAMKFEARLESIVNRFSALSGSHSRVLNAFVKKYASKLQSESNTVSNLSRKCKSKITDYRKFEGSITNTEVLLTSLSEQVNSISNGRNAVDSFGSEIKVLQDKVDAHLNELRYLECTKEYLEISAIEKESKQLQNEEHEIRQQTIDLFGHVNRAITKYSYGLPTKKDLFIKLQTLVNEPWKIFYHDGLLHNLASNGRTHSPNHRTPNDQNKDDQTNDFFEYLSILREIQSAITKGKIDLKDSEKVSYYLKQMLEFLPSFNSRLGAIRARKHFLKEQKESFQMLQKITTIKDSIKVNEMSINEKRRKLESLESELSEKERDFRSLVSRSEIEFSNIIGQHYEITF